MTDTDIKAERPAPVVDTESSWFWAGTVDGILRLQRCQSCGEVQYFPRWMCCRCHSPEVAPFDASGMGTVYSRTVIRQHHMEPFRSWVPYVVALVDLDEGPRMISNIVGCDVAEARIGLRVRVRLDRVSRDAAIPVFEPLARSQAFPSEVRNGT